MEAMLDAAVRVGRRALSLASEGIGQMPQIGPVTSWSIVREAGNSGDEHVLLQLVPKWPDAGLARATGLRMHLAETDELADLENKLRGYEPFARREGKMLRVGGMGVPVSAESVVDSFLNRLLSEPPLSATDADIEMAWLVTLSTLDSLGYKAYMVAQLDGFEGVALDLGDGLEIARLTDEEILTGFQFGAIRSPFGAQIPVWLSSTWCLRQTLDEQVEFFDPGDHTMFDGLNARRAGAVARMEQVVHALRLFKDASVSAPVAFSFSGQSAAGFPGVLGTVIQFHPLSSSGFGVSSRYELDAVESTEFVTFFSALNEARDSSGALDSAVRRFGYAGERQRSDDRLTDLVIAAEALLLDDSERGEKRFQVSLRLAFSVEIEDVSREGVFEFLRRAYDVRSAIVHGGIPKRTHLIGLAGTRVTMEQFSNDLERVVRELIRQSVVSDANPAAASRWKSELFGSEVSD